MEKNKVPEKVPEGIWYIDEDVQMPSRETMKELSKDNNKFSIAFKCAACKKDQEVVKVFDRKIYNWVLRCDECGHLKNVTPKEYPHIFADMARKNPYGVLLLDIVPFTNICGGSSYFSILIFKLRTAISKLFKIIKMLFYSENF